MYSYVRHCSYPCRKSIYKIMTVRLSSLPDGTEFLLPDPMKQIKYVGKFKKMFTNANEKDTTNCIWIESYVHRKSKLNGFACYIPSDALVDAEPKVQIRL